MILFSGQALNQILEIPVPGTVLGMMILLILLLFKVVKLEWVNKISDILLSNLSLLFIPAGVAIMNEFSDLKGNLIPLLFIIISTTMIVMVITGYTVQMLIKMKNR